MVTLWLAKDTPFSRRLDFHEIAMHVIHPVIEPLCQVIELHKLLRQVAPRIAEMQHASVACAFFNVPLCHIDELQMMAEPAGAVT